MGFFKSCSGPPKFKNIRGPLGPGPFGPSVNASLSRSVFNCFDLNYFFDRIPRFSLQIKPLKIWSNGTKKGYFLLIEI